MSLDVIQKETTWDYSVSTVSDLVPKELKAGSSGLNLLVKSVVPSLSFRKMHLCSSYCLFVLHFNLSQDGSE